MSAGVAGIGAKISNLAFDDLLFPQGSAPEVRIECTLHNLHFLDPRSRDSRLRIEAEANLFAAQLLMPPKKIRQEIGRLGVSLRSLTQIAQSFDVSKEAMGRAFVAAYQDPVAIVISLGGKVQRFYRHEDFPFLPIAKHKPLPLDCVSADLPQIGETTQVEEIDPDVWLAERDAARVLSLTEQALSQRGGFAMTLLQAELDDIK